jgi:hypothetical protein
MNNQLDDVRPSGIRASISCIFGAQFALSFLYYVRKYVRFLEETKFFWCVSIGKLPAGATMVNIFIIYDLLGWKRLIKFHSSVHNR